MSKRTLAGVSDSASKLASNKKHKDSASDSDEDNKIVSESTDIDSSERKKLSREEILNQRRMRKSSGALAGLSDEHRKELEKLSRNSESISVADLEMLEQQLGYTPFNVQAIVYCDPSDPVTAPAAEAVDAAGESRGQAKSPVVAVLYPLNFNLRSRGRYSVKDGLKPFPTTFWMTSPALRAAVSSLEDSGWINRIGRTLGAKEEFQRQMVVAHRRYAEERWGMLSTEDRQLVDNRNW